MWLIGWWLPTSLWNKFLEGMGVSLKSLGLALCGPHDKDLDLYYMVPRVTVVTGDLDSGPSIGSLTTQTKPYLLLDIRSFYSNKIKFLHEIKNIINKVKYRALLFD